MFSGRLGEGGAQDGQPGQDLSTRTSRPVAGALARGAGLLQPFGLLFEPRGPLQDSGVGIEVFAESLGCAGFEVRFRNGIVITAAEASQSLFQVCTGTEASQEKSKFCGSEGW